MSRPLTRWNFPIYPMYYIQIGPTDHNVLQKLYNKFFVIKSYEPAAGVLILSEKVRISKQVGLISSSGKYVRIHGKDILNINLIGIQIIIQSEIIYY